MGLDEDELAWRQYHYNPRLAGIAKKARFERIRFCERNPGVDGCPKTYCQRHPEDTKLCSKKDTAEEKGKVTVRDAKFNDGGHYAMVAWNCIDGDTRNKFKMCHSKGNGATLTMNLKKAHTVDHVKIYNRFDCCKE